MKKKYILVVLVILSFVESACNSMQNDFPIAQEPTLVAEQFTLALIENNSKQVYSLTTTKQKTAVENWMKEHDKFSCSAPPWAFDDQGFTTTYTNAEHADANSTSYNVAYLCRTSSTIYIFRIDNVTMLRTEKGWLVDEWGETCEARDYSTCFDEPQR